MEAEIFFKGAWLEVCDYLCFSAMSNEPGQVLGCGAIRSDILQATALNGNNRDFYLTLFGRPLVAGKGDSRLLYHFQRKRISCDAARSGWAGLSALVSSDWRCRYFQSPISVCFGAATPGSPLNSERLPLQKQKEFSSLSSSSPSPSG
jgi:hypothetical protein